MPLLTLEQCRAHCRIDGDFDDAILGDLLAAASDAAAAYLGRELYADQAALAWVGPYIDPAILAFVCVLVMIAPLGTVRRAPPAGSSCGSGRGRGRRGRPAPGSSAPPDPPGRRRSRR